MILVYFGCDFDAMKRDFETSLNFMVGRTFMVPLFKL